MNPPSSPPASCCADLVTATRLSRRRLLAGMAAAGAAGVTTSVFGDAVRQASFAATPGGNTLVVLSFRGGVDGLGLVVPHGDVQYAKARPRIAVPTTSLLHRDAMFGLHPRLAPLGWLWQSGELAAVHAVGLPVPNRSHFEAMELVEDADPGSAERRGWVNRMAGLDSTTPAQAVHLGDAMAPAMISGPTPTVATRSLKDVRVAGSDGSWAKPRRRQLEMLWGASTAPLASAARTALTAADVLGAVGQQSYTPAASYPTDWRARNLSEALRDTARLIKADIGTEVVSVDFGSWDMHQGYGNGGAGWMGDMVDAFARSVDAFVRDLGALRSRVTLVTISEFGRRVAENASSGLDHGWGNAMLLIGGGVKGGAYHGTWPGLGTTNDIDFDLQVTTDYRQVLGEVVHRRFPATAVSQVFPGVPYSPVGVMR
jgi:uncharacterized protein (DUF1501 family)